MKAQEITFCRLTQVTKKKKNTRQIITFIKL